MVSQIKRNQTSSMHNTQHCDVTTWQLNPSEPGEALLSRAHLSKENTCIELYRNPSERHFGSRSNWNIKIEEEF